MLACISTNVCKTSADTQKAVLEKNDHDGYECKYERSCVNSTLLSVRFLFLSKVQSYANEKIRFITFDSVLKPSKSVFIIYEYGPKCFDSDLFLKSSGCSNAYKE